MLNITYKSCYYLFILLPVEGFVIFTRRFFTLSWNSIALSQSNCRNFSCSSITAVTFQFHPWLKCYFLLFQTDYHARARTPPTRSFFGTPFTYASSVLSESLEHATTWLKPWPPGKSTSLELYFSKFFLSQFNKGNSISLLEKLHWLPLGELVNVSPRQTQAAWLPVPSPTEST